MTAESIEQGYNLALADLLGREGLIAEGEQSLQVGDARGRADVLLDFDAYVACIEAEFGSPARRDADRRFPDEAPAQVYGLPLLLVIAVGYPRRLKNLPPSRSRDNLRACEDLRIAYRYYGEDWSPERKGSVADLAEVLRTYWVQSDSGAGIGEIVDRVSGAIARAAEALERTGAAKYDERGASATKALIWLNALLFQELLAAHLEPELLPPEHRSKRIFRPLPSEGPDHLTAQWRAIRAVNWWPIFDIAIESLEATPRYAAKIATDELKKEAASIAESGIIRRHDVAGRIFHRLLDTRKFLATNYTTVSAAILLTGLAFDYREWDGAKFADPGEIEKLRIVDPACGSGTLLMAAAQEIAKRARRACPEKRAEVVRAIFEGALYGFDVVPAAIHLAASVLCMTEPTQIIRSMNLWRLHHDVIGGVPRMGSLDFLSRSPAGGRALPADLFEPVETGISGERVMSAGERMEQQVSFPAGCDLIIANPPYTRAGGPGDADHTEWNPIFGSVLDAADAGAMQVALSGALSGTPGTIKAGLGSAFLVLANENLRRGGRLAFVLPNTVLTGSEWAGIRTLLRTEFRIDWIVTSHDPHKRARRRGMPGRIWASFSESTTMAEVLVVATKDPVAAQTNVVRFVNLAYNPTEPIEAIMLTRKLLGVERDAAPYHGMSIDSLAETSWGNLVFVPQRDLTDNAWDHASFIQPDLVRAGHRIRTRSDPFAGVPTTELVDIVAVGPYHLNVRGNRQGLFRAAATYDPLQAGIPALWHHKARLVTRLEAGPNARLTPRRDKSGGLQRKMLERSARLHMALDVRSTSKRVVSCITKTPMLGIRSWVTLKMRSPAPGKEEALCLWLNSAPGFLLRIMHANRPYFGRSSLSHTSSRALPVLDVNRLSVEQLAAAAGMYADLRNRTMQRLLTMHVDPVRQELNDRLCESVLGIDPAEARRLADMLVLEPAINDGKPPA